MSIVKLIHKALSDSDIRKILGHETKIIKYSELARFTNLNELLPNPLDRLRHRGDFGLLLQSLARSHNRKLPRPPRLGLFGLGHDLVRRAQRILVHPGVPAGRLRAEPAVLGAATRLGVHDRAQPHLVAEALRPQRVGRWL